VKEGQKQFEQGHHRGLGRRPEKKPQQQNFLLRAEMPVTVTLVPRVAWWDNGAWLDQGQTGTCVGHGCAHRMEDSPITHPHDVVDPFDVYRRACKLDPWPENDSGDVNFGTSVDAGARALKQMGLISAYYWAFDLATADRFLRTPKEDGGGPLIIGINWYESMFNPVWKKDALGDFRWFIDIDESEGGIAGGHCLVVNGRNPERKTWRLKNSWGRSWGVEGRVSMSDADMARLISEGGEFCSPTETKP